MVVTIDERTPVVVGVGAVQQRCDDPGDAREAVELMAAAVERAAADAGAPTLATEAQLVAVPKGLWGYHDPARLVAGHFGATAARTARFELGVLQQTLVSRACAAISRDGLDIAVICGGEAKYRSLRAAILGVDVTDMFEPDAGEPDEVVTPADDVLHPIEITRMLPVPARQYAVIETALRHADGVSVDAHAHELARLWAAFSAVAADNPDAWSRAHVAESTMLGNEVNAMLASPYTKLHCSQWNVDQAAAIIICSVGAARRFGVPTDRWVFPHALAESNFMTPLVTRAQLHRSAAMAAVGAQLTERCGVAPADCDLLDLYSCFPSAVRLQLRELGIDAQRQLTVTGGMSFGGGPLNNYTLQSLAKMCQMLRAEPAARGLVTAVSGIVTKFGAAIWSCTPPSTPLVLDDVSTQAKAGTDIVTAGVDAEFEGDAVVAGYTVVHERGVPTAGIAVLDTPAGARTVATSTDSELASAMTRDEWVGRTITIHNATLTP